MPLEFRHIPNCQGGSDPMSSISDERVSHGFLDNYISFMATHRGTVESVEGNAVITSEAAGFSAIIASGRPLEPDIIGSRSVRTVPWNDSWTQLLAEIRPRRGADLVFMMREIGQPERRDPSLAQYHVRRVQTINEMRAFAETQALSFLGADNPEFEWWRDFMRRKAMENRRNRKQQFFLAFDGSHPVGTLISVYGAALVGLYAIATVPEHRRRAVCSTLVDIALSEASRRGVGTAVLQVMSESTAELVYRKLGFREVFRMGNYEAA
jgi:ribosomal protein S18 acetylase RimI-like enzyme